MAIDAARMKYQLIHHFRRHKVKAHERAAEHASKHEERNNAVGFERTDWLHGASACIQIDSMAAWCCRVQQWLPRLARRAWRLDVGSAAVHHSRRKGEARRDGRRVLVAIVTLDLLLWV